MKKIVGLIVCLTVFAAGMLVGLFAFDGPQSAEGAVPIQISDPAGWQVSNFIWARADANWEQPALKDDCGILASSPNFGETAKIFVRTASEDFILEYPNVGSRITACPGRTMYFPPATSGRPPTDKDR